MSEDQQEEQLWDQTRSLIEQKQPKSYDAAVVILRDLHALASHRRSNDEFHGRLLALRDQFRTRPGLISRLTAASL